VRNSRSGLIVGVRGGAPASLTTVRTALLTGGLRNSRSEALWQSTQALAGADDDEEAPRNGRYKARCRLLPLSYCVAFQDSRSDACPGGSHHYKKFTLNPFSCQLADALYHVGES
jgi:hypothetical protein